LSNLTKDRQFCIARVGKALSDVNSLSRRRSRRNNPVRGDSGHGNRREIGVRGKKLPQKKASAPLGGKAQGEFLTFAFRRLLLTRSLSKLHTPPHEFAGGAMLDIVFTIGTLISVAMFAYGAYLAIHYTLFHDRIETTETADELPEIGYYVRW
jgi:hypothetical protein